MNHEVMQQALADINTVLRVEGLDLEIGSRKLLKKVITTLREAIAQPAQPQRPINCGTDVCSCIECLFDLPVAQPECSTDPAAPHGFNRNGSHSNGRYTCDCEGWTPQPADAHQQRPVEWQFFGDTLWTAATEQRCQLMAARGLKIRALYASPPQRQPLTGGEIDDIWAGCSDPLEDSIDMYEFASAIEAAHDIKAVV